LVDVDSPIPVELASEISAISGVLSTRIIPAAAS